MLQAHETAALQFSGGKDSTALLHLARPWLGQITVLFADPGVFPHLREHVERSCRELGARLEVIEPAEKLEAYHERTGLPSDIVPVWDAEGAWLFERKPAVQSTMTCCWNMLLKPMHERVLAGGWKVVLRGHKACDERKGVPDGHVDEHGIQYRQPLWAWSDERVMFYLRSQGVRLPEHYAEVSDSLDCELCTGHLLTHSGADKLRWVREHRPELWSRLSPRIERVRAVTRAAMARMEAACG